MPLLGLIPFLPPIQENMKIIIDKLKEKGLDRKEYLDRLEEEADIKRTIGEKLGTNMFSYPITLQHYVDLFWECGSTVGAGRGSSCSGLNHYLLGVTQLDPIKWNFPFWNDGKINRKARFTTSLSVYVTINPKL